MAFSARGNSNKSKKSDVDFNALQEHVISAAGTAKKKRSLPGVISTIVDLGVQDRPDGEELSKLTQEQEAAEIKKDPKVYFKTKKDGKRYKCRPLDPIQQVAITVDFPQITVDKGQFFGNSSVTPLRLLMNSEITLNMLTKQDADKKTKILQKGFSLGHVKRPDGVWGFDPKNTLHKLAVATGLIEEGENFTREDIDKLIGRAAQFEFRIFMRQHEGTDLEFYTEQIKLAGIIPEGVPVPSLDEKYQALIQFDVENDLEKLKQLRRSIVNTMKRSSEFNDMPIKAQLEKALGMKSSPTKVDEKAPAKEEEASVDNLDQDDFSVDDGSDSPF